MIACRLMLAAAVSSCSLVAGLTLSASAAMGLTPPVIEEVSVLNVAGTSATFQAKINPQGSETTYRFEYGTSAAYGSSIPVPDGLVGSGSAGVTVSAHPQDLSPGTTYHYRVVAQVASRGETVPGNDGTFTTQRAGSEFALPDGRQWELVSPPDKRGALIFPLSFGQAVQAAEDGSAITYMTNAATEPEPQGYELFEQTVSRRGAQGWSTHGITIPKSSSQGLGGGDGLEYMLFSPDLSEAFTEPPPAEDLLSAQASEQTLYIRRESLCAASANECFLPLVTGKEGFADVPSGTKFGEALALSGVSPDFKHVAFISKVALTATPIPATANTELYEWSADAPAAEALQVISTLPASEGGGPTTTFYNYVGTAGFSGAYTGNRHAISDDGSRVFWSGGNATPAEALYMRDMRKRETVRLDVPQPGAPSASGNYLMLIQIASSDGSKVFFTSDGRRLTVRSGAEGRDLYECEILEEAGKLTCRLTDLTPENMGHAAEVGHMVLGASEDGSYLYFVANGVLGDAAAYGATRGACESGSVSATCNLYEYHNGKTTFIASLTAEDGLDWAKEGGELGTITARVSPDGRYLAFMSDASLTGYDNRDASSGAPDQEVYLYDAQSSRLVCTSCNPTGGRPSGARAGEFTKSSLAGHSSNVADVGHNAGEESWIAANLPGGDKLQGGEESLYQPRLLRDDGRLFFNSSDALLPQDINGQEDVYQFEPEGTGDCTASSVAFDAKSGGCASLISSGTSPDESGFLDAGATGGDVFFLTDSRLGAQDYDTSYDVYDAHECSAAVPCAPVSVSSPPCASGDSCKGAPSPQPPVFGAPASATFAGAGNVHATVSAPAIKPRSLTRAQKLARALKACRKKSKPKRAACERQARRRYAKGVRGAAGTTRKARG